MLLTRTQSHLRAIHPAGVMRENNYPRPRQLPQRCNHYHRREKRTDQSLRSRTDLRATRCREGFAGGSRTRLISFVPDRPGHDRRYAIDPCKKDLGWSANETFEFRTCENRSLVSFQTSVLVAVGFTPRLSDQALGIDAVIYQRIKSVVRANRT